MLSVIIIAGYAILYTVFHSVTASQPAKDWSRQTFGPDTDRWYRLAYNSVSTILLLPFVPMLLWLPDMLLYTLSSPWRWLALGGQALALTGTTYGVWQTDAWHFLGVRQLRDSHKDQAGQREPTKLVISGLYRLVRHPLYFFGLILIWLTPQMTVNRLALAVILSAYLYIGTFFEERRLVQEFGQAYRQYQQQVPRLIPLPLRLRSSNAPRSLHDKP